MIGHGVLLSFGILTFRSPFNTKEKQIIIHDLQHSSITQGVNYTNTRNNHTPLLLKHATIPEGPGTGADNV